MCRAALEARRCGKQQRGAPDQLLLRTRPELAGLLDGGADFVGMSDFALHEVQAGEDPLGQSGLREVIKDAPAIAAFGHEAVCPQDG